MTSPPARALGAGLLIAVMAGCSTPGATTTTDENGPIAVTAGDTTCDLATADIAAGRHTFQVTNTAGQVTEVYVYARGDRIVGEAENIGPATKRELTVDLPAGDYQIACKPGMVGNGNRAGLKVTGAAASAPPPGQDLQAAVASYRQYVESETRALADTTAVLAAAITAGDLARAKQSYPAARLHYERIEPIAESFGDLDPLIDMRAGDATEFVGFHALEQKLFEQHTLADAAALTGPLTSNVGKLAELVKTVELTPLTMGNGAKSLLDEVAISKVTGEEERYSRIDLLDFAGNVDGARYVYTALRPALQTRNPQLVSTLDQRFPALIALLDTHRAKPADPGYIPGSPYVSYDALTKDQVKALVVEVDAISEPLSRVSAAVAVK